MGQQQQAVILTAQQNGTVAVLEYYPNRDSDDGVAWDAVIRQLDTVFDMTDFMWEATEEPAFTIGEMEDVDFCETYLIGVAQEGSLRHFGSLARRADQKGDVA